MVLASVYICPQGVDTGGRANVHVEKNNKVKKKSHQKETFSISISNQKAKDLYKQYF